MRSRTSWCLVATILVLCTSLLACKTDMQMSASELRDLGPDEGLVLGSVRIRGGKDVLGRTAWELLAEKQDKSFFSTASDYSIETRRGEEESVFLTKMEAGSYHFYKLLQPGFSTFEADIHIPFEVLPGQTVYLGRLALDFPDDAITVFTLLDAEVEDDREACVKRAQDEYGIPLSNLVTRLMTIGKH